MARAPSTFRQQNVIRAVSMTHPHGSLTLDQLPLYADEAPIAVAILGVQRAKEWPQIAALLEGRGLPKIDALMGGRYVPAIKAFFDKEHGLSGNVSVPFTPDGAEDLGAWKRKRAHQG